MRASSAARDATDADALELGGDAPSPSSSPREGFEVVDTFVVDASLASMQLPDVGECVRGCAPRRDVGTWCMGFLS